MLPVVIAAAAAATGGPSVNRRFAANPWLFPFRFRRGMRKGRGHLEASVQIRLHHFPLDASTPNQDGLFIQFHFTVVQTSLRCEMSLHQIDECLVNTPVWR
jgi:hypothetical protein